MRFATKAIELGDITLRRFRPSDYFYIIKWIGKIEINHFFTNRGKPKSKKEALSIVLKSSVKYFVRKNFYCWAIIVDGKPNGIIRRIENKDKNDKKCFIHYFVNSDYWGRGICSTALSGVIACLKADGFDRIYASCDVENKASERVMQKAGMVKLKTYKNSYKYANGDVSDRVYYKYPQSIS